MKSEARGVGRALKSFAWLFVVGAGIVIAAAFVSPLHAQSGQQKAPPQSSNSPNSIPPGQAKHVALDGELEVQIEDSVKGSRVLHFLKSNGQRIQLQFADQPPGQLV